MIYNSLEIQTNGSFTSCCTTRRYFHKENGEQYNVESDGVQAVWNSEDRKNFIDNFDTEYYTYCQACVQVEDSGGESKRLREIRFWDEYYRKTENKDKKPEYLTSDKLEVLDLKMGNTCNLACAICSPHSSSKWASIYKQLGVNQSFLPTQWQERDSFWNELSDISSNIKKIELTGGEPFMIKKQEILLDRLVELDIAKDIEITWITNCTQWPTKLVSYFKEFKMVRIMLSLDNTHEQFEYIRYPAKWETTFEIFNKFKKLRDDGIIELGISHSIGALNIWRLPEFHAWCREHKVNVYNNVIMNPMTAKDLPEDFKQVVMEKLSKQVDPSFQVNPIIGEDNWFSKFMMLEGDVNKLKDKLSFSDKTRNMRYYDVFPELKGIIR